MSGTGVASHARLGSGAATAADRPEAVTEGLLLRRDRAHEMALVAGNVYVSDSSQGVVWRTTATGGVASAWVDSPLLRTDGVPPFGANGLRFNKDEGALFVANTGNDTVVMIPVNHGTPGAAAVFTNGINGADGLVVDGDDNLWVVANQGDEIVVVDATGRAIAKLGDFGGLADGSPIQMLFPASLRFSGNSLQIVKPRAFLEMLGS